MNVAIDDVADANQACGGRRISGPRFFTPNGVEARQTQEQKDGQLTKTRQTQELGSAAKHGREPPRPWEKERIASPERDGL
jgi:hypothetical protein